MKWIALIVPVVFLACSEAPKEKPIRPVRFKEVQSSSALLERTFAGVTQPATESHLSFRVSGTIKSLAVHVGDEVKKGDLIATIDPNDYLLQVEETEAKLHEAEARLRNAKLHYSRMRELYETRSASRTELDKARTESESMQATVKALSKRLALARSKFKDTRLTAPQDGTISSVDVEVNEHVNTGESVVMLASWKTIEVRVSIPENLIFQIHEGDPSQIRFDAIPGRTFPGVVTEVGVTSEIGSTFTVTSELLVPVSDIRSGMAAEVRFLFQSELNKDQVVVPTDAIKEDQEGSYVFLVIPKDDYLGEVQKRPISISTITGSGIEVAEGLNPGDKVITAGTRFIHDGQTVKMKEE